jgi:pimeloyl-ACP methyl ester carboxylesterase
MEYNSSLKFYYSEKDFLNYEVIGNGHITLVFLHGFGASLRNWDDVIPYLPQDLFTSYLIDLKGSGLSSKPGDTHYSIVDQTKLIASFIKENNIKNYSLIGHSLGGGVALFVALEFLENPELKPGHLILLDTAAYNTDLPFFVKNLRIPLVNQVILNIFSSKFKAKYTLDKIVFNKKIITPELIERYSFFMVLDGYNHATIETAKKIIPKNFEYYTSRYHLLNIPTLIIWGKEDIALPLTSGEQLSKDLPNAKLQVFNECGHNPHEEYPEEVAKLILSFTHRLEKESK